MTNVTITFVSPGVINILNETGGTVVFEISKLLTTGVFDTAVTLSIPNDGNSNHSFTTDGIYKVYNPTAVQSNTIIISSSILDHLEDDVKEILLSNDIDLSLPHGYDMVMLVLLSILFVGNSAYQNILYNVGYITNYTAIAEAIDRCQKYLDRQGNTPQSTNKIWQ